MDAVRIEAGGGAEDKDVLYFCHLAGLIVGELFAAGPALVEARRLVIVERSLLDAGEVHVQQRAVLAGCKNGVFRALSGQEGDPGLCDVRLRAAAQVADALRDELVSGIERVLRGEAVGLPEPIGDVLEVDVVDAIALQIVGAIAGILAHMDIEGIVGVGDPRKVDPGGADGANLADAVNVLIEGEKPRHIAFDIRLKNEIRVGETGLYPLLGDGSCC